MRYPNPSPYTHMSPFFEYHSSSGAIIRPLEHEIWAAIRLLSAHDICVAQLKKRRSPAGRRGQLKRIASQIGSCITQAEEYFRMALQASPRAAPLLHYYSMLNLTKALIYLEVPQRLANERGLYHGLVDPQRIKNPSWFSLRNETVTVRGGVFRSLHHILTGEEIAGGTSFSIFELLRYCVWISNEMEELGTNCRLVHASFSVALDASTRLLHGTCEIEREDVRYHCGDVSTFEAEAPSFLRLFRRVASGNPAKLRYETRPISYASHRGRRVAHDELTREMRKLRLYRQMMNSEDNLSAEYLIPLSYQGRKPLPEPCVLLAITFYLGSLVRYQPHIYDHLLGSEEAWLLESFVRQCPLAFSHIMLNHLWKWEHLFQRP